MEQDVSETSGIKNYEKSDKKESKNEGAAGGNTDFAEASD